MTAPSLKAKFDENQPRDENGRWVDINGSLAYAKEIREWAAKEYDNGNRIDAITDLAFRSQNPLLFALAEHMEKASDRESMVKALQSGIDWTYTPETAGYEWNEAKVLDGNSVTSATTKSQMNAMPLNAQLQKAMEARVHFAQAFFHVQYGNSLDVYRGIKGKQAKDTPDSAKTMSLRMLSSWTPDPRAAFLFSGPKGVIVKTTITAKDVFGMHEIGAEGIVSFIDDRGEIVALSKTPTRKISVLKKIPGAPKAHDDTALITLSNDDEDEVEWNAFMHGAAPSSLKAKFNENEPRDANGRWIDMTPSAKYEKDLRAWAKAEVRNGFPDDAVRDLAVSKDKTLFALCEHMEKASNRDDMIEALQSGVEWTLFPTTANTEWAEAKVLGGNGVMGHGTKLDMERWPDLRPGLKAAMTARVRFAQAYFRVLYGNSVDVYRGISGKQAAGIRRAALHGTSADKIELRALSSWTTRRFDAENFADDDGVVVQTTITPKDVFSINAASARGKHSFDEDKGEIVVLSKTKTRKLLHEGKSTGVTITLNDTDELEWHTFQHPQTKFDPNQPRDENGRWVDMEPSAGYMDEIHAWARERILDDAQHVEALHELMTSEEPLLFALAEHMEKESDRFAMLNALQSGVEWRLHPQTAVTEWNAAKAFGGNGISSALTQSLMRLKPLDAQTQKAMDARRQFAQAYFHVHYGKSVEVYRGIRDAQAKETGKDKIALRMLSSWSPNKKLAAAFAEGGIVVRTTLTAKDVFGIHEVGVGGHPFFKADVGEIIALSKTATRPLSHAKKEDGVRYVTVGMTKEVYDRKMRVAALLEAFRNEAIPIYAMHAEQQLARDAERISSIVMHMLLDVAEGKAIESKSRGKKAVVKAVARYLGEDGRKGWTRELQPLNERAATRAGAAVAADLNLNFSVVHGNLLAYARNQTGKMITGVNRTTQSLISDIIQGGIDANQSTRAIARLIAEATGFSLGRAKLIARTETTKAFNGAPTESLSVLAQTGNRSFTKTWSGMLDDIERDEHVAMEGETVDIDEEFSNGLQYPSEPNCRCVLLFEETTVV